MNAVVCSSYAVQIRTDLLDKRIGEHRIKIRADVRVIAFRIFEEQFLTIIEDGKMYEMLGVH